MHVVFVAKCIVTVLVFAQFYIIIFGSKDQRRTATPSTDHFGGDQLFFLRRRGLFAQVPTKRGDPHLKLSKGEKSAVATQDFGLRTSGRGSQFIRITDDELSSLDWSSRSGMDD